MNPILKKNLLFVLSGVWLTAMSCTSSPQTASETSATDDVYKNLPFEMDAIERPVFPDYRVSICDFGAQNGGKSLCTDAINEAIRSVHERGGGTVVIPAGLWLTGPIVLQSNVNLYTEKNALVVFSSDYDLYPIIGTSFEGRNEKRCQSPISALNAENIAVTGEGVFDGSGDKWRPVKKMKMTERQWKDLLKSGGKVDAAGKIWYPDAGALKASELMAQKGATQSSISDAQWEEMRVWLRPVLVSIRKSKKVLLEGVTFKNSPAWCIHPLSCESLIVNDVKVFNPWYSQNGDALDVESCKNVLVSNCLFDAGDDAICLKSGRDEEGRLRGEPCENVIVRDNVVLHGHGGFVIGSEMSGGVKNVSVSGCSFVGTDTGLRFKSARGRGGVVENIHISDINMINISGDALTFDLYYMGSDANQQIPPVDEGTPLFKDIFISDVYCRGAGRAAGFNGLPELPVRNIQVENMVVTDARTGVVISRVDGVKMSGLDVEADGPAVQIENASDVTINGKHYDEVGAKETLAL